MWWDIFLIFSLLSNILLFFYVRWLLKTVAAINEDVETVTVMVENFKTHVSSVYELETFYGDDTLKSLMEHAGKLSDELSGLDLILNEPPEEDLEDAT